jgi:hypothetical protein
LDEFHSPVRLRLVCFLMTISVPHRWLRRRCWVLLALLWGTLFAPTSAWASCGRYGITTESVAAKSDHIRILSQADQSREEMAPGAPAPRPCSGPFCSEPSRAPDAPVVVIVDLPDHWGLWSFTAPGQDCRATSVLAADSILRPMIAVVRLDRPPRLA